jgi:sirohydrochlorin cobaltochelatase
MGEAMNKAALKNECVVLLAHGSKDPRWRIPFEEILRVAQSQAGEGSVRLAYMEFIEPTLMDAARECAEQGISSIRIFPLFLAMGVHLATDIPRQAEEVREQFPELKVEVLQTLGEDPRMVALMQQIVVETIST